ncbi:hypothetical protein AMK26_31935 [Streptomyces sp. CB03234]|uniref:hypothetical protein n=1 Tax=Streptomyces sp. (strain CB03234) TaxID=1703937 RepID=UPI00076F32D9|nr:hypothetical protein [Streptomyces sp. CB03234]AME17991.1 hypothetical protein [Streptomyces sp. CB03234]OKJ95185.1 hypothetical protein AMK26_31935 [Streptomyces sp. CB03234]
MRGPGYGPGAGALVLAVLAAVSACGTLPERRDEVTAEVTRFEQALDAGQHERLCAALAPATREELEHSAETRCEQAIGRAIDERELPAAGAVRGVDVYGDQARVVLERDTVFLSHFPAGWKVTAAGCRPRPERPYQCEIKGG